MRASMTLRIRAQLPKSEGAIATAIITGERGGIDPEDEAALRDAGLAHVLAIAGLHMALVGAGLFWLVRAVLAAIPALALAYPIKKWAASVSMVAVAFYIVNRGLQDGGYLSRQNSYTYQVITSAKLFLA